MKKQILLLVTISIFVLTNKAYSLYSDYNLYDWSENTKLTKTDLDTSNSSIIVFMNQYFEYVYEDNLLLEYKTIHKRVKLISHASIDENNKVYIPMNDGDLAVKEKARVIKLDGSIKELKSEEIKEAYDQESGLKYHYFAFEGIEVGCEIEYLYCIKHTSSLDGRIVSVQTDVPVLSFEHKYIAPINIGLKFKMYNACPDAIVDTLVKDKNVWTITGVNVPRLKNEESCALNASLMKYAFKLNSNTVTGAKDIYSYGSFSSFIYDNCYNSMSPKELKSIKNLIKSMKLTQGNEETTIREIENYIKTSYIHYETSDALKSDISYIIANKTFNDFGSLKLFANIFKELNIEHEIVTTSNRFENKFDKDYECYAFLTHYLIYFPKIKKILSPSDNFTRLGFPDNDNINNYGLFVKTVSMGDYNTGLGKIKFIQGAKYDESTDILNIKAEINSTFGDTKLEIVRNLSGYLAMNYQPYFDYIKDEVKLKDFKESLIKTIDKEGVIESLDIENYDANSFGQRPLIAKATLKSDYFFEKAGTKYLFKAGLLIGPQMELYKKEERLLPLELPYCHSYKRTIVFNIPSGYKIVNLNDIKIKESFTKNDNESMLFISDYTVEGNSVKISIEEFYKEYVYTVSEFEDYRRVANASANFNKVVLVFEKQ